MARNRVHHRRTRRRHRRRLRRSLLGGLALIGLAALTLVVAAGLTAREVPAWIVSSDGLIDSSEPTVREEPTLDWRGRRGIYLTSGLAASRERLQRYVDQLRQHGLNTLVIDVKDNSGVVAYPSEVGLATEIGARRVRFHLTELVDWLHERDIYLIARQVVFNDPKLAEHIDSPIAPWVDPSNPTALDYNLSIAREVAAAGVDELQFDYIRYPDGGSYEPIYEDRYRAITSFLETVDDTVGEDIRLSADVYGRTMRGWNQRRVDPIGQNLEDLMPHADVLSPMVYPSHYESARYWHDPYGTVHNELALGLERGLTMRPFLQAFERYRPTEMSQPTYVAEQIRAARDLGFDGYLFWNPQGKYANLWEALDTLDQISDESTN